MNIYKNFLKQAFLSVPYHIVYCTHCRDENDYCPFCGCIACHYKHFASQLLICDGCNKEYHTFCVSPPLSSIPDGQWFCPQCQNEGKQGGRLTSSMYKDRNHLLSNNQFSTPANAAITEFVQSLSSTSTSSTTASPLTEEEIKRVLSPLSITDLLQVQTCMLSLTGIASFVDIQTCSNRVFNRMHWEDWLWFEILTLLFVLINLGRERGKWVWTKQSLNWKLITLN